MEKLEPHTCKVGVEEALNIILGKWKPIILLHLQLQGTRRFSDLKKRIPGISQKMLSSQLKELEEQGVLEKITVKLKPLHIEYHLTEKGKSLIPVFQQLEKLA